MKLELKHLAPYLPYGLDVIHNTNKIPVDGLTYNDVFNIEEGDIPFNSIKPILRPLSDLRMDEMDILRGMVFTEAYQWTKQHWNFIKNIKRFPETQNYKITQKLIEWHFDVYGLIPEELAIDINSLEKAETPPVIENES
jgi:hypothetical protein